MNSLNKTYKFQRGFHFSWNFFSALLIFLICYQLPVQAYTTIQPDVHHKRVAKMVVRILKEVHYEQKSLDDSISSRVYQSYLNFLDHNKSFFLASDIRIFERFKYQFDEYLNSADLDPAFYIYNTFLKRVDERVQYVNKCLEKPFDFKVDEDYVFDREKEPWAEFPEELDEIWRQRLKFEALSLKLAEKDWNGIFTTLTKRYQSFKKRIEEYSAEDVFQLYMNSFAESLDPHSGYMSPFNSENFRIQMQLSFQGIGAQLTTEDDYTKVSEIIPGGPADLSKQLMPNDKIIGVGQGKDGEIMDVIGMKLDDVVLKIRGKKGTMVRLEVLPAGTSAGSSSKIIELVRDEVVLKRQQAQSDTIEIDQNGIKRKLGVITIPSFYADYEAQQKGVQNYRSTTNDVRQLIRELKAAGIEGLIIDLRGNSGGYLPEAVSLTGLFIEQGPVVQVRRSKIQIETERDQDATIEYDGPLTVLVDRISASASEIFAAAIQDYGRGLILGAQTFGKGTVQTIINLNRYMPDIKDKLGQVRVTMAKFYRIAGGSTQHTGVIPDINYPSLRSEMDIGENKEPYALLWDEITAANYRNIDVVKPYIAQLRQKSAKRVAVNPEFQYINEDIQKARKDKTQNSISLNEAKRRAERDQEEAKTLERTNQRRIAHGHKPLKKGEKEDPKEKIEKDPWLDEAQQVTLDLVDELKKNLTASQKKNQLMNNHPQQQ
ncbi:carboxy terminal-processing peptidase [candidate division KSB1 bacterium]|nr:carboxy terminal-processing peptidase [candidate division KSB1 bacterium]